MATTPEQYTLIGHRPSALDQAFYCGQSAELNAKHGAGRAALLGSAFHAACSGSSNSQHLRSLLTIDERNQLDQMHSPLPITVNGVELVYADAAKELPVGLTLDGQYAESGEVLTAGTLDLAWTFRHGEQRTVYVADIKKRTANVENGPDSLQLAAYGLAFASKVQADYLCMGLWDATDAFWLWGELVDMEWDAPALFERVKAAALNRGEYVTGRHCMSCYACLHCPEQVLPAIAQQTELAALTDGSITPDNAPKLLRLATMMEETGKQARMLLKMYAKHGGIVRENGKVWGPSMRRGRESVSVKAVRDAFGDKADKVIKVGESFEVFAWTKEKP